MIAIINISKDPSPFGWHDYELRINHDIIATFRHKREDGLAKCLLEASKAAEKAKWLGLIDLFEAAVKPTKPNDAF